MNILLFWQCGMDSPAIKRLFHKMDVKFCAYFYENKNDQLPESDVARIPIYSEEKLEFFCQNESDMLPLDAKILEGMQPYSMTAFDIINRWRKSITTNHSYFNLREIYMIYLRYWNNFLLANKIDFVYFQFMPHIPNTYFIYAICKIHNIPIVIENFMPLVGTHRENHYLNVSLEKMNFNFEERLNENKKLYTLNDDDIPLCPELERYFENYSQEAKKVQNVIYFNEKNTLAESISKYWNRGKIYISKRKYKILLKKVLYLLTIKQKNKKIQRYAASKSTDTDFNVPFFFFPLHMQPECTTLPCGGVFVDQLEVVRMVASSLPDGFFLYVKEHPAYWTRKGHWESMGEARSRKYYDTITSLKNVKLIKHSYSSLEIMDKCSAVVAITGTAGFEALFKNKPVLVFANHFYHSFPGVLRIKNNEDCVNAVKQVINGEVQFSMRDLRIALKTMEPYIFPMAPNMKSFIDSGGEPVSEEELIYLVDSVACFAKNNYGIQVKEE